MSTCDASIREALADVAARRAPAATVAEVRAHRAVCAACDDEARLLEALAVGRPSVPPALAARIDRGVREGLAAAGARGARSRVPAWGLAAAAAAVLALGTPSILERVSSRAGPAGLDVFASPDVRPVWVTDEPLVAGAPVLESLSDEELEQLLEDMAR